MLCPCNRIGTRKPRRDSLEQACPATISFGRDSILRHTQPSPNETKTKLDYTDPSNHKRSPLDNSIECANTDKCRTEAVHYMLGTQEDLYGQVSAELASAVRSRVTSTWFAVGMHGIHVVKSATPEFGGVMIFLHYVVVPPSTIVLRAALVRFRAFLAYH